MAEAPAHHRVRALAEVAGESWQPSPWIAQALACEPERRHIPVSGASIETLSWGPRGKPGLVFLPGNGAHADWWSHIAPHFMEDWCCAALSWSGMGRSDHRELYTIDGYADEIEAVIAATGLADCGMPPIAVAHSFGSLPAMMAGGRPGVLTGIISVDAAILQDILRGEPDTLTYRPNKRYPSVEAALAGFRMRPHQPITDYFIVDRVARQGLVELPETGEWTWRADPFIRRDIVRDGPKRAFRALRVPLFQVWGERSELSNRPGAIDLVRGLLPAETPQEIVRGAGHHIMLDYPQELVATLRGILNSWPPAAALAATVDGF